jgi:uncharacterized OB-fold protein
MSKDATPPVLTQIDEFLEGCRHGELLIQRCETCGRPQFYPRAYCGGCHGQSLRWEAASGAGTVYSFTVVRRAPSAEFADRVPYVLAVVELAEGPRLMSTVVDADPADVEIGMPVTLAFEDRGGEAPLPVFRREGAA